VPVLWLLIGLFAAVIAASVATVMIARHAADEEIEAPARVVPILPPGAGASRAERI
jgi:formate-dependent nitrite reductase membrane component NrfD